MTARRVLELAGAPDHVCSSAAGPPGPVEWRETWEYDSLRGGHWSTLRITWRDHPRRPWIEKIEEVGPYWLDTEERVVELPCFG